jgi:2-polyprenyl-3-methyl-5-hydroxy-6-metoxy-1,4-benzoquinol methylase
MSYEPGSTVRILVAIASWGTKNDRYLSRLVTEYRSMSFDVDLVVLSNKSKEIAPGVEVVVVDLQGKSPWTLPFPHKQIFAHRLNDYDLFIYSEDDTLVTEENLRAYLEVSAVLPEGEIAGFLRFEQGPDGSRNFPEVHGHFHWDPASVCSRGEHTFAYFTNEHSACYVLTQQQLRRAIDSGGFLVGPHQEKYDLLCTAATDPYTQCGLRRLICISRLEDFLIHHLPNKYVGSAFGVDGPELHRQIDALGRAGRNGQRPRRLFETETKLRDSSYSKDHYEPVRPEIVSAIPSDARSVLSVGCGWGATEAWLAEKGLRVVAIPLDPVIPGGAEAKGVEMVYGDFQAAREKLANEQFDCLLLSNVLHLVPDPIGVLASFGSLLSNRGVVVLLVPNVLRLSTYWDKIRGGKQFQDLSGFEKTGVQVTSHKTVRSWFRCAGLGSEKLIDVLSPGAQSVGRLTLGLMDQFLASEVIAIAKRS